MGSSDKKNSRRNWGWLSPLLVLPLVNWASFIITPSPFPSPAEMHLKAQEAAQTSGFLTLGMRRLASDLAFVQLLMYYGEWEQGVQERANENGAGNYPEIKDRTLRIMDIDPYFNYAVLFGAGSLAFNLDRPEQAFEILQRAVAYEPKDWKYRAYAIAIGLKMKGDMQGVLNELTPVMMEPDCPTQLKNMLAFLNYKLGYTSEAIRIYKDILNSRDPDYAHLARLMLIKMGVPAQ